MSEIQGHVKLASGEKVFWVLDPNVKVVIGNRQFDGREITTADQVIRSGGLRIRYNPLPPQW
jgi:hypothetical protein